jgi:hypothetical protein
MIYEYRVYFAMPGKKQLLVDAMEKVEKVFEKYMKVVGFWTPLIGEESDRLIYIVGFKDMADRDEAWAKFGADPDWHQVRPQFTTDGGLMLKESNSILRPTSYSPSA